MLAYISLLREPTSVITIVLVIIYHQVLLSLCGHTPYSGNELTLVVTSSFGIALALRIHKLFYFVTMNPTLNVFSLGASIEVF